MKEIVLNIVGNSFCLQLIQCDSNYSMNLLIQLQKIWVFNNTQCDFFHESLCQFLAKKICCQFLVAKQFKVYLCFIFFPRLFYTQPKTCIQICTCKRFSINVLNIVYKTFGHSFYLPCTILKKLSHEILR